MSICAHDAMVFGKWFLGSRLRPGYRVRLVANFVRIPLSNGSLSSFSKQPLGTLGAYSSTADSMSDKLFPVERKVTNEPNFFPKIETGWSALSISTLLCDSLCNSGFPLPSSIQVSAIPEIFSEKDVIMAAQTGSGKTLAYLVPILNMILESISAVKKSHEGSADVGSENRRDFALILCPNPTLCWQVTSMARTLLSHLEGTPPVRIHCLVGGESLPAEPPQVVVASLAALLNHLFCFDPRHRRRTAFLRDVKWVVVDEADMMLSGGYSKLMTRLLGMLQAEEKRQHHEDKQQAAEAGGPEESLPWTEFEQSVEEEEAAEEGSAAEESSWGEPDWEGEEEESVGVSEDPAMAALSQKEKRRAKFRDFLHKRKEYTRSKRYIFVAATLPEGGKKSVGELLKRQFPQAVWVTGSKLHHTNSRLEELWLETSEAGRQQELTRVLQDALQSDSGAEGRARILVFANSTASVKTIGSLLEASSVACHTFHAELAVPDRLAALHSVSRDGGVLVCTDAMARGVDIPNVTHVVQAEFALSAVDYLHRVGRTARAGRAGAVVNLCTPGDANLASAMKKARLEGQSIESAFSRKRSFRKKIRKAARQS